MRQRDYQRQSGPESFNGKYYHHDTTRDEQERKKKRNRNKDFRIQHGFLRFGGSRKAMLLTVTSISTSRANFTRPSYLPKSSLTTNFAKMDFRTFTWMLSSVFRAKLDMDFSSKKFTVLAHWHTQTTKTSLENSMNFQQTYK